MTRDILANFEAGLSVAKDTQIQALAAAFGVEVGALFPAPDRNAARVRGLETEPATRCRADREPGSTPDDCAEAPL